MTKEIKIKQATKSSGVENKEQIVALANTGEVLGDELIEKLSQHGCSFEGLVIETYALTKAWAALLTIAHSVGFEVENLFEKLIPSFMVDMESIINELEEEEKK